MSINVEVLPRGNDHIERSSIVERANQAFSEVVPGYLENKRQLASVLKDLDGRVRTRQLAGEDMTIADQIAREAGWLIGYTADWARAEGRLKALADVLEGRLAIDRGQEECGSWGPGCTEWYRKLEPTVDMLPTIGTEPSAWKPLAFMKRLQDAKWTLDYLYRLQISDIKANKVNFRDELGAVQSALSQLIFKDGLREILDESSLGFRVSPELEQAYRDFLDQTQHPRTGYWGPWYRFDDRLIRVQDLSFTFHVISYRSGEVARWPLIIDTTLDIEDLEFPAGWRPGKTVDNSNHNNFAVATIFALGWSHIDADRKGKVRAALEKMLRWCLMESIGADGFKSDGGLVSNAFYFGVRFLDKVGYWDPAKRFWRRRLPELPDGLPSPATLAKNLLAKVETFKDASSGAQTVRSILRMAKAIEHRSGEPPP